MGCGNPWPGTDPRRKPRGKGHRLSPIRSRWFAPPSRTPADAGPDPLGQVLDLAIGASASWHEAFDLLDPVQDRGVVPAEVLADLDQREAGEFAEEVHGDVPGGGQRTGPALGHQIIWFEPEVRRGLFHDQ